jgi:hypothetical protein
MASMRAFHRSRSKTQPISGCGGLKISRVLMRFQAIDLVAPSQFIDEMLEIG